MGIGAGQGLGPSTSTMATILLYTSSINYGFNLSFVIHKSFYYASLLYFFLMSSYGPEDNASRLEYVMQGHPLYQS